MQRKHGIIAAGVIGTTALITVNLPPVKDYMLRQYILGEIVNGRVPVLDTSKYDIKNFTDMYIQVAKDLGDDFGNIKEKNLYNRIREHARKTRTVLPSVDKRAERKNK